MERGLLEVLQQDAALALDDGLRQAGGARGVEHPERVVEGELFEDRLGVVGDEVLPGQGALGGGGAQQRDVHHGVHGRQLAAEFGDDVGAVVVLAAVVVPVDGEQDDRLDLLEPVEDAAGAEVGGAGRPDGADGGGREERDDRLRDVREVRADPVAGADAAGPEGGGEEPSSAQVRAVGCSVVSSRWRIAGRSARLLSSAARRACSA
ncbi:hypothetical protein GCM10025734_20390 [Kitasatospora paranensis]